MDSNISAAHLRISDSPSMHEANGERSGNASHWPPLASGPNNISPTYKPPAEYSNNSSPPRARGVGSRPHGQAREFDGT